MAETWHAELQLPIFEPTQPLLVTKLDLERAPQEPHDSVFRRVWYCGPEDVPLKAGLDIAQREFGILADMCGIQVVPFTYGLYPADDDHPVFNMDFMGIQPRQHKEVPVGYALAAQVDVVRPHPGKSPRLRPRKVHVGMTRYRNQLRPLIDTGRRQIQYGIRQPQDTPQWWIVDIEPRMRLLHKSQYPRDRY